jgi:hypothetical protein
LTGTNKSEFSQRSPERYSRSSESRSKSPPSRWERERPYSPSPPRRKRTQSRSPSPRRRWSPPPRDRPQNVSSQSQPRPPTAPYSGRPPAQPPYPYGVTPQYPQQIYAQPYQPPPVPANSGFYRENMTTQNRSTTWNQGGQYQPPPSHSFHLPQAPTNTSSQQSGRYPPSGGYDRGGSDNQNRTWR